LQFIAEHFTTNLVLPCGLWSQLYIQEAHEIFSEKQKGFKDVKCILRPWRCP